MPCRTWLRGRWRSMPGTIVHVWGRRLRVVNTHDGITGGTRAPPRTITQADTRHGLWHVADDTAAILRTPWGTGTRNGQAMRGTDSTPGHRTPPGLGG